MKTFLGWLLSGAWQWLLGKIGMSSEQKLGRAEVTENCLKTQLQELQAEDEAARDTPHGKGNVLKALKNGDM